MNGGIKLSTSSMIVACLAMCGMAALAVALIRNNSGISTAEVPVEQPGDAFNTTVSIFVDEPTTQTSDQSVDLTATTIAELPTSSSVDSVDQTTDQTTVVPPKDFTPSDGGYQNANGTFFTTYGAPDYAVPWMNSTTLIFNRKLPADTPTLSNSATIANHINEIIRGQRLYSYGSGFEDDFNAPYMLLVDSERESFQTVEFSPERCGASTWWNWKDEHFEPYINGAYSDIGKQGIPLPSDFKMQPGDGDYHLVIYDYRKDILIEFWRAQTSNLTGNSGLEVCWGGIIKNFGSQGKGAFAFPTGADAAGLTAPGLTITLEDVRRGEIRHAIGISTEMVNAGGASYPANRNDGYCNNPSKGERGTTVENAVGGAQNCLYEGQYLRLPADFNVEAIAHPYARMVAKAARDYGIVVHDEAGCFCFQAESGLAATFNGLASGNLWAETAYKDAQEWDILYAIDWSQLEVMPPDWNKPSGYQIKCAVPQGTAFRSTPNAGDPRCQTPAQPYEDAL